MLQMNDIGLQVALERAAGAGTDIFIIPREHFAEETPEQGDEGWWYKVRSVMWWRECRRCVARKESTGFAQKGWNKKQPAPCAEYVIGLNEGPASTSTTRKANGEGKDAHNRKRRSQSPGTAPQSRRWSRSCCEGYGV